MAANFVSFMLIEDPKFEEKEYQKAKDQFFKHFYDIISQAVFYTLYLAYPKSRQTLDEHFKRRLTDTFSQLYAGTVIHSAAHDHWDNLGGGQSYQKPKHVVQGKENASLADPIIGKNTKSRHEQVQMRYSPLVNRYLMNHNYETINNVREWKMRLIQRTQVQDDIDLKFKKFKQMARAAVTMKHRLEEEFE